MNNRHQPPPAITLLLQEVDDSFRHNEKLVGALSRSGFLKELRDQARYSLDKWSYLDDASEMRPRQATLCPSGALNPFAPIGKCSAPDCRVAFAYRFSRTIGVYAERIVLPDPITSLFAYTDLRSPKRTLHSLLSLFRTLKALEPLIRSGAIEFSKPTLNICEGCRGELEHTTNAAARRLEAQLMKGVASIEEGERSYLLNIKFPSYRGQFRTSVAISRDVASQYGGLCNDVPLSASHLKELVEPIVRQKALISVQHVLFSSALAQRIDGTLALGSREDVRATQLLADRNRLERVDNLFSANLPWISQLTPAEIVALRDSADKALPAFRAFLSSQITSATSADSARRAARELGERATEVDAELKALGRGNFLRAGLTTTFVGLSIALFKHPSAEPLAAASFAAALAALHGTHSHVVKDVVDQTHKKQLPGYVLIKARDLYKHGAGNG